MAVFRISLLALLFLSACGSKPPGVNRCATPLTYVVNESLSGEDAIRHSAEYRVQLSVGERDFAVSALVDTASASLIINEADFDYGASTRTGKKPFSFDEDEDATAVNAKDTVDIACTTDITTRFALAASASKTDNILGLAYRDTKRKPHEKNSPSFVDQMVAANGINNVFSLALCGKNNSRILLGEVDEGMKEIVGNFIPIVEKTAYVVPAISLRTRDNKEVLADFPKYDKKTKLGTRTIINSASSFLLLPPEMATAVADLVQQDAYTLNLSSHFPANFFRTERSSSTKTVRFADMTQLRKFPTFEITFRGVDGSTKALELSPLYYFKAMDEKDPLVRTFAVRDTTGDVELGQPFLENHYAYFNRKEGVIGFGDINVACGR